MFLLLVLQVLSIYNISSAQPLCNGSRFEPCVCSHAVPSSIKYRVSDPICPKSSYPGDRRRRVASVRVSKAFRNSFSIVVRNGENSDRSPYESSLCSRSEFNNGVNKCSRWKTQKIIKKGKERIFCLGASGKSKVFRTIQRITIKVSDIPDASGQKDIRRMCLESPKKDLN